MHTEFARSPDPLFGAWLDAAREAGLPFTEDLTGPTHEGFAQLSNTMWKGRRHSVAVAYLRPN